jgi:hypothetical protein
MSGERRREPCDRASEGFEDGAHWNIQKQKVAQRG